MTHLQSSIPTLCASLLFATVPLSLGLEMRSAHAEAVEPEISLKLAASPPPELVTLLGTMDQAASQKRLKAFMQNFEKSFVHTDGLSRRQLQQTIRTFWNQFETLSYQTTLESWEETSPGIYKTVTLTTVSGSQQTGKPNAKTLKATVRSEQQIQNSKIINQTVLEEKSQVTSGKKPPSVTINLPSTVKVGEDYFFDVIVDEPLGDRILLGAAIEETVNPQGYLNPSKFEIESLVTGGLFKIGQAPSQPTDQWISALLIQDGGTYIVSQRISVVNAQETVLNKK
jgi:hypothetical protein